MQFGYLLARTSQKIWSAAEVALILGRSEVKGDELIWGSSLTALSDLHVLHKTQGAFWCSAQEKGYSETAAGY